MPWMVSVGTSDCAEAAKDSKYNETDNINFFIIHKHSVVTKITLISGKINQKRINDDVVTGAQ